MDAPFDPFAVEEVDPLFGDMDDETRIRLVHEGNVRLEEDSAMVGWHTDTSDPEFERRRVAGLQKYQQKLTAERKLRQGSLLKLLSNGYTVDEACWQVNVTKGTFYKWRSNDVNFQRASRAAQHEGQDLVSMAEAGNYHALPFHILRKMCFGRDTYGYQQKIIDIIEYAPEGEIVMILLPPGVGKTMTVEDWLSIELAKNQKLRVMYISESKDLGERTMEVIKTRFENEDGQYSKLSEMFGALYHEDGDLTWRADAIRLPGGDMELRDYNLRTRGMRSQISSIRADIIIMDDIQTSNTLGQTNRYMRDIRRTILTRREGAIRGKVIYIGTRLEMGDLPERMVEEGMVLEDNLYIMPLINSEGVSNFEEVICTKDLPLLVRQQGDMFQAVYQQNPAGGGGNTFSDIVSQSLDPRYTVNTWHEAHEVASDKPQEILGRVTSIDPALTGGNAIIAAGWSMTDIWIYDLDLEFNTGKMSYAENKIEEFLLAYQSDTLIIEDKAYQKALLTSERIETMCSSYGVSLKKHTTGGEKHDTVFGVAKMETPLSNGRIHMPWGDEFSTKQMTPLRQQLLMWRPDVPTKAIVQDLVMALWFIHVYVMYERRRIMTLKKTQDLIARNRERHGPARRAGYAGKTQMQLGSRRHKT